MCRFLRAAGGTSHLQTDQAFGVIVGYAITGITSVAGGYITDANVGLNGGTGLYNAMALTFKG